MKKYFDKKNNRLIFTGKTASSDFWDRHWDVENFKKAVKTGTKNRLVTKNTLRYIKPEKSKKILEAGCGNGQFVYAFDQLGYDSYGVDYAEKTVSKTKSVFPELKISVQDVKDLSFPDNYFDGYWSVGVIEHFFEGYQPIINEIDRILKPKGYLFITFPHMSVLRKIKAKLGFYPAFNGKFPEKEEFYQFALDQRHVIKKIKEKGFKLVNEIPYSGTKGLKDEVVFMKPLLQKIYDSQNIFLRIFNYGASLFLAKFSSHAILLIFRKENINNKK